MHLPQTLWDPLNDPLPRLLISAPQNPSFPLGQGLGAPVMVCGGGGGGDVTDGFVEVGALLRLPRFAGVSEEEVRSVVDADPKGRFALRPNPLRIRANQGHSLQVGERGGVGGVWGYVGITGGVLQDSRGVWGTLR